MSDVKKNLLLLLITIFISLSVIEFGLRILENKGFELPIQINSDGIFVHTPNLDKYIYDNESKKKVHIITNNEGFVGYDYKTEKSSTTLRIALLGDSFTEGMQVDYDHSFWCVLKTELENDLLKDNSNYDNIEVMDFGIGGTGTVDALLYYDKYVKQYNPDLVILNFYTGNDLGDNARYLSQKDLVLDINKVYTIQQYGASDSKSESFVRWKDHIYRSSAIVRLIDKFIRGNEILYSTLVRLGIFRPAIKDNNYTFPSHYVYYLKEMPIEYLPVVDFTSKVVNELSLYVNQNNSIFLLGIINNGVMVNKQLTDQLIQDHPDLSKYKFDPQTPNNNLISALPTSTLLMDSYSYFVNGINNGQHLYLNDIGHFNEDGNKLYAQLLADKIQMLFTSSTK